MSGYYRRGDAAGGGGGGGGSGKSPFQQVAKYSDDSSDYPTTVTICSDDFSFEGALIQQRRLYRYLADYSSGFAIISTPKIPNPNQPSAADHTALLDLAGFCRYFANPAQLAAHLHKKGVELMDRWRSQNSAAEVGYRRPVFYYEDISKFSWTNARNKEERTIFELQISTYMHTQHVNRSDEKPRIQLGDLKLMIKAKTTSGLSLGPDKSGQDASGFKLDRFGYNANFVHFLGLLRSPAFAQLVREATDNYKNNKGLVVAAKKPSAGPAEGGQQQQPQQQLEDEQVVEEEEEEEQEPQEEVQVPRLASARG
jgi:hypothetical protein